MLMARAHTPQPLENPPGPASTSCCSAASLISATVSARCRSRRPVESGTVSILLDSVRATTRTRRRSPESYTVKETGMTTVLADWPPGPPRPVRVRRRHGRARAGAGGARGPRRRPGAARCAGRLKPLKFAVSFVAYAGTLAWLLGRLRQADHQTGWVIVAAAAVEMLIIIGIGPGRGVSSHFNTDTPFDADLFSSWAPRSSCSGSPPSPSRCVFSRSRAATAPPNRGPARPVRGTARLLEGSSWSP